MAWEVDIYVQILAALGGVVLLTAWLPMVLKEMPLSLPILCVGLGAAAFGLPALRPYVAHPLQHGEVVEHATEFVVIVSLMGAGLKIDRRIGWRRWKITWRLLGIAMPLTILALAGLAMLLLGLVPAAALLLAAALAPTDPVLAGDVQVGAPGVGEEDEARFALTSEAGLNDGLAFPFVNLALALAAMAVGTPDAGLGHWLLEDVLWKLGVGLGLGYGLGRLLGYLTFRLPNRAKLSRTGDGFVALGATLLVYGITEIAHGYGFLAVFVAAICLRQARRDHEYHHKLHDFAEETERLLAMLLLVLFGGSLAWGGLLLAVDWRVVGFALIALFLVRPASGMIGLAGLRVPTDEKLAISFFGIRGLGSAYYLAYAFNDTPAREAPLIWSTAALTVLISILLHGTTVTPALRALDRRRERRGGPPPEEEPAMEASR